MDISQLESAVMQKASAEAERITAEARRAAEAVIAGVEAANAKALAEAVAQAEAREAAETARQLGRARHEGRLEVLKAKNEVLDRAFNEARGRLRALDDGRWAVLIESWLLALPGDAGGALRMNPRDAARLSEGLLKKVNASRPEGGRFTRVVADAAVPDGFVVDGEAFTIDVTMEARLKELRESLAGELVEEIFGK